MNLPAIALAKPLRAHIEAGHPWVYADALARHESFPPGTLVQLRDQRGFVCVAIYEPDHPIACRVWGVTPEVRDDTQEIARRVARAFALRRTVCPVDCDAYRLLHGEADLLPGWVADLYGDVLVVRCDGAAARTRLPQLLTALDQVSDLPRLRAVVERASRSERRQTTRVVRGELPDMPLICREYAWRMEADVIEGQKTGWFIDQRENRRFVFEMATDLRVANVFSYTGGFSLAAALGGARQVSSIDIAEPATAAAKRNFEHNGLDADEYEFVAGDAFAWFESAVAEGRRYDLLIVDPPSFAPNRRALPKAKRAYARLFAGALALLENDGFLAASSCSSHIGQMEFLQMLDRAVAEAGRSAQCIRVSGAGPDHPLLSAFPEGHYLKFVVYRVA